MLRGTVAFLGGGIPYTHAGHCRVPHLCLVPNMAKHCPTFGESCSAVIRAIFHADIITPSLLLCEPKLAVTVDFVLQARDCHLQWNVSPSRSRSLPPLIQVKPLPLAFPHGRMQEWHLLIITHLVGTNWTFEAGKLHLDPQPTLAAFFSVSRSSRAGGHIFSLSCFPSKLSSLREPGVPSL